MDSGKHMVIGALLGFGGYLSYKYLKSEPPSLVGTLMSLLGGAFVGLLPDLLEPANSPNHRSFFHSVALLLLLTYGNFKIWQDEILDEKQKIALSLISAAYSSHLVADSATAKGLPILF